MAGSTQTQTKTTQTAKPGAGANNNIMYLFAYFLTFISGIIVFLMSPTDKRLKLHAFQAIVLGVIIVIIAIISSIITGAIVASSLVAYGAYPYTYHAAAYGTAGLISTIFGLIEFLVWVYGMYIGFKAYSGEDVAIPYVTNFSMGFVK